MDIPKFNFEFVLTTVSGERIKCSYSILVAIGVWMIEVWESCVCNKWEYIRFKVTIVYYYTICLIALFEGVGLFIVFSLCAGDGWTDIPNCPRAFVIIKTRESVRRNDPAPECILKRCV